MELVYLNRRSDFRLKVSVVDGREEWRRKVGDFVCCSLKKEKDPGREVSKTSYGGRGCAAQRGGSFY